MIVLKDQGETNEAFQTQNDEFGALSASLYQGQGKLGSFQVAYCHPYSRKSIPENLTGMLIP